MNKLISIILKIKMREMNQIYKKFNSQHKIKKNKIIERARVERNHLRKRKFYRIMESRFNNI